MSEPSPAKPGFAERMGRLRSAQKRKRGVPIYTLYVNRSVGRVIAAASPAWVTPNVLTVVGAVLTYGALLWLMFGASPGPQTALVGAALVVGFFFDSADGQLARLRRQGSASGEWLDHVLDSGRIVLMHVATLWFLVRTHSAVPELAVVVCTVFLLAASLMFFGLTLFEKLDAVPHPGAIQEPVVEREASLLRSVIMLPVDYGTICVLYLLLPWPLVFLVGYCILAAVTVLSTSFFLQRWYRGLRRDDRVRREVSEVQSTS